jgi:hypothetical protein
MPPMDQYVEMKSLVLYQWAGKFADHQCFSVLCRDGQNDGMQTHKPAKNHPAKRKSYLSLCHKASVLRTLYEVNRSTRHKREAKPRRVRYTSMR